MLEFKLQVAGHIEIYSDKRGKLAEFDNIFLDQGLNALATTTMPGHIWIGSGSAEYTTGTTIDTVSEVLLKGGAERIYYICVSIGAGF